MLRGYLSSVHFASGLSIDLSADTILVVIGPNNSGKSATLSDIQALLTHEKPHVYTLTDLDFQRTSTVEDFKSAYSFTKTPSGDYDFKSFRISDYGFTSWTGTRRNLGAGFATLLISNLSTRERLGDCDPPSHFDIKKPQYAEHPFQKMYLDDGLELAVSNIFRTAFKADLVVHRAGSSSIPLYVGERPIPDATEDRVSRGYLDRLEMLAPLEKQGDGV